MKLLNSSVFKMDKRIYIVFILVISVAIANAVLSTIKIRNNKNTIFEITQYTNPSLESLEEFNLMVTRSRMFISNWVYLPNNHNDKSSLLQINKVNYPRLKSKLIGLTNGWRSDGNVEKLEKLFAEYEEVIREQEKIMKSLYRYKDYQDPFKKILAEEQLESEIIPNTNRIMVNLRELITIKKEEAGQMQNTMLQDNAQLLVFVFSLAILIIASVMMAGAYMMKNVILPLMRVREILLRMSAGELPELKPETEGSALAEMKTALYQLREGLQRTSSFAGEMGKGNFDASFHPLSEKDVLGSVLIEMRDKLKQSESALRKQSDTLQKVNTELENKALLLEDKNMAVEDAHKALAFKADQLERSNKYKSDFLANMSHELRTPLNSVLILAKLLGENRIGNMTEKQVEHAKVIHKSGSDLLIIINDILDLSKIEAGKLQLHKELTAVSEICNNMRLLFIEVSRDKQINFTTVMDPGLPEFINTDRVRVEQVLKNLLGNAFKFTPEGGDVILKVHLADEPLRFHNKKLSHSQRVICFSVCDSGIGIQEEHQKLIFDAFNQADSSITRKFGGTGLGLAICRQLSALLGGEINLVSKEGEGSVFSLFLSADTDEHQALNHNNVSEAQPFIEKHTAGGFVLLLCDNVNEIKLWESLFATENYVVVSRNLSESYEIDFSADIIVLDATLSDNEYINKVKRLREAENTRNSILICRSVSEYIPAEIKEQVKLHTTAALNNLLLVSVMNEAQSTHKIINNLMNRSQVFISPRDAGSFNKSNSEAATNQLSGIKVLIADDDIRNIYSMTSVFEHEGAEVLCAMDGFEALEIFKTHSDLSIILMDIMMPGKDGLQAIREIRSMGENNTIPIIAVTAKAMRDDREICINAGASDYITKPVRLELLLDMVYQLLKEKKV